MPRWMMSLHDVQLAVGVVIVNIEMLALTSARGKLGSAVLRAILENNLIDSSELVVCTSSDPKHPRFDALREKSITVRYNNFDDPASLEQAFTGCDRLFLVSSPRISMDFNDAPLWKGREAHHRAAIDAARKVGVKHIYYTSLGFANPSKAAVMRAHIRTEAYLRELKDLNWTIIREGLYNESWPLYFGYYYGLKEETRKEVIVAGDGPISWTAIADMAFGTAKVLSSPPSEWAGKTFYLSQNKTWTLHDIAQIVSRVRGDEVQLEIVTQDEYERYYAEEKGRERAEVEWWSTTYNAVLQGECNIVDTTLENMLREAGRRPKPLEETIKDMLQ
ncbi:NAD(P)-binding protein [Westerdykella ornata]|uniref:NAD(P)-binding protein n=1 Tax=Westerdykella ornata TaxID=318751 RepID=A0A6A6JXP2_WESOR|nr:NAD(P)-binding protein [Westerdykella ornata]KAF2281390.1 NAD(P)-binding protein [Westerdykella ornata]